MKKTIGILLAILMIALCACGALAEEVPQPEGGKKFESDWAIPGGLVTVVYEEEGYRVWIGLPGSEWEYSCYYEEAADALVSVSSMRTDFTLDDMLDKVYQDPAYEGLDEEGQGAEFKINENGKLIWKDARDNAGEGLEFANIGKFSGVWKNLDEEVQASFAWNGLDDPDRCEYTVYIQRGLEGADYYALYLMSGIYNEETGKLDCLGTITSFTKNAEGEYDSEEDGETVDAFFSMMDDGRILYETANGIELEYDLMGEFGSNEG